MQMKRPILASSVVVSLLLPFFAFRDQPLKSDQFEQRIWILDIRSETVIIYSRFAFKYSLSLSICDPTDPYWIILE